MSENLEYRIAKLELEPGDVVVVKFDCPVNQEMVKGAHQALQRIIPSSSRILVIGSECDLSILSAADIASRTGGAAA